MSKRASLLIVSYSPGLYSHADADADLYCFPSFPVTYSRLPRSNVGVAALGESRHPVLDHKGRLTSCLL